MAVGIQNLDQAIADLDTIIKISSEWSDEIADGDTYSSVRGLLLSAWRNLKNIQSDMIMEVVTDKPLAGFHVKL
jgi:hypothetical protein